MGKKRKRIKVDFTDRDARFFGIQCMAIAKFVEATVENEAETLLESDVRGNRSRADMVRDYMIGRLGERI